MEFGFKQLKVYQKAYQLAKEIFEVSKSFPVEEKYSLTDQIRRSSRAVCANIAEAYRSETVVWLDFAMDCNYISKEIQLRLEKEYEEVGRMLGSMADHPEKFIPK